MLVKGSLLIRLLNGLTSPNPIQWTLCTANTVCPTHILMSLLGFFCWGHYLWNLLHFEEEELLLAWQKGPWKRGMRQMIRWDGMFGGCVCSLSVSLYCMYDRSGYGAKSGIKNGPLWQTATVGTLAPGNDSRTEAETGHCLGSQWICIQNAALARPGLYGKSS